MSNAYAGWLFVRADGSIGFDAVPLREGAGGDLPPCVLQQHDIQASSLQVAYRRMAEAAEAIQRPVLPCGGAI